MIHVKKVLPEYFEALRNGSKRFELRREDPDDPCYAVGDYLALNEIDPERQAEPSEMYTGRCLVFEITYVLREREWLAPGCAALSLAPTALSLGASDLSRLLLPVGEEGDWT